MSPPRATTEVKRHPLQRFDAPGKGLSGALHVCLITCRLIADLSNDVSQVTGLISFYRSFKLYESFFD